MKKVFPVLNGVFSEWLDCENRASQILPILYISSLKTTVYAVYKLVLIIGLIVPEEFCMT